MIKRLPLIIAGCCMLFATCSCKKAIEDKKREIMMDAMTSGVWIVEQFFEGATNISSEFLFYEFRFYENGTITSTKGNTITNGTWADDISNFSITSQFPDATDALKKLNGVWKIKDSYWDYVKAEMQTPGGINVLHLRKKP
jgi:hypothetical protein